jgi:hypothetical protein
MTDDAVAAAAAGGGGGGGGGDGEEQRGSAAGVGAVCSYVSWAEAEASVASWNLEAVGWC